MAGVTPSPGIRGGRLATWPVWTGFVGLVVLSTAAGALVDPRLRYTPLLASVVVFGVPHGAADYLVPARLGDTSLAASVAVVGAVYLLLGGGYAVLWFHAPVAAAVLFVALTWLHWGQGDVHTLVAGLDADHLDPTWLRAGTLVVRGGLPMVVPFLAFPDRYLAVVGAWVGLFGGAVTADHLITPGGRTLGAAAVLAVVGAVLGAGYRRAGATRAWRIDAAETALLLVAFATVSPVVAVGAYFCAWHSVRHVARLVALDDANATPAAGLSRFARQAAPPTVAALLLLVTFGRLVPTAPSTVAEAAGLYLVFVAVLTVPHVVVVAWMDRREGVWG